MPISVRFGSFLAVQTKFSSAAAFEREAAAQSIRIRIDRTPAKLATHDVGFPDILTEGRSQDEAQALYRREDYFDPEGARGGCVTGHWKLTLFGQNY